MLKGQNFILNLSKMAQEQLITSTQDKVSNWHDMSGNNNDSSQIVNEKQPTYTLNAINGHPALLFDGNDDFLEGTVLNLQNYTQFIVAQRNSNTGQNYMTSAFSGKPLDAVFGNNTNLIKIFQGLTTPVISTTTIDVNEPHIITVTYSDNNDVELFINGMSQGIGNKMPMGIINFPYSIGGVNGSGSFDGYMGEIVTYNRVLSNTEILQINTYLSSKWGITLSA